MDFLSRMREKVDNVTKERENITEDENSLSSQDMINDARERRLQKENLMQCNECDFKSASKTLVIRHQQAVHMTIGYQCDQCEYMATTKGSLAEHKTAVHNTNKFQCNQCDHKEETEGNLMSHKESTHEKKGKYKSKRIQCEKCDKRFNKQETFKTHMKKIHNINVRSNENETQTVMNTQNIE